MITYFLVMSFIVFVLFGSDKKRAEKKKYRISEKILMLFSIAGGAFGGLAGMTVFRHKTHKLKFLVAEPALACLHAVILLYFM